MLSRRLAVAASVVAVATLAACGTTEAPADSSANSSGDTITVTDALGTEVTINAPVENVVATEWVSVEHTQTVGLAPVGVSDIEGYNEWSGFGAPLQGNPVDVGDRSTPSIDKIADLAPDVIFVDKAVEPSVIADLNRIAPVVALHGSDAKRGLDAMYDDLRLVGEATGRADAAETAIEQFVAHLDKLKASVSEAGLANTPILHVDGYENGGQIDIRAYAKGSLLASAAAAIGFTNAWQGEGDAQYGLATTDVEGLVGIPDDAQIIYMTVGDRDVFQNELSTNPIWTSLPAVEAGNVHRLNDGIWLFGGVHSMTAYVDALTAALSS